MYRLLFLAVLLFSVPLHAEQKVCFNRAEMEKLIRLKAKAKEYHRKADIYRKAIQDLRSKHASRLREIAMQRRKEKARLLIRLNALKKPRCSCAVAWVVVGVVGTIGSLIVIGMVVRK